MPANVSDEKAKILFETVYDDTGAKKAKQDISEIKDGALEAAKSGVKWAILGQAISKVVGKIAEVTRVSADYIETLNVLQVAFDGNTESIRRFADTYADTLNLDDATIIDAASKFKMLSKSMGLATETGEKLSELMTKITLDYASLYNYQDIGKAQTVLQNAMQGYGKSLKQRSGVSVLETTVQTTLDTLGVDAYVEDMNDAEKAIARVIAIEYQLMSSQGDLARTIEAPANQMRIMKEQLSLLARNIGNVFIPIVAKLLPYLNAILIVLNAIISVIARLVGYKEDMFDVYTEPNTIEYFDGVGAAIDGVGDSAEKTAKKLQGLRSFDKLNVIKSPTDTGGAGGGAGGGLGGINPNLLKAFNSLADQYKTKLDDIETKATKIANKILGWLGFAKKDGKWVFEKVKPGTVLATIITVAGLGAKIKQIYDFLKKIGLIKAGGITKVITLLKDGTVAKNMGTFSKGFTTIAKALGMSSGGLAAAAAAFVAIGAAVVHAYTHIEEFRNKVNDAFGSVGTLFKTIFEKIEEKYKPLFDVLFKIWGIAFEQGWKNIKTILGMLYDGVVGSFSAIADTVGGVAEIITDIINGDYKEALEDLKHLVHNLKEDWDKYWEKIGKRFDEWKDDLKNKIENEWIPSIKKKLQELPDKLEEFPEKAGEAIGKMYKKMNEKAKELDWGSIGKWILDHILLPMLEWDFKTYMKIINFPIEMGKKLSDSARNVDWWSIGQNILDGIINGMYGNLTWKMSHWAAEFGRGIAKGLGIASPSKLMLKMKIGDYTLEGITKGMEREMGIVEEEAQNIAKTIQSGMEKATTDAKVKASVVPMIDDVALNSDVVAGLSKDSFVQNQGQLSKDISSNNGGIKNATFVIQVGNKEIAKQVITDLQDMAKDNGKPITIGG